MSAPPDLTPCRARDPSPSSGAGAAVAGDKALPRGRLSLVIAMRARNPHAVLMKKLKRNEALRSCWWLPVLKLVEGAEDATEGGEHVRLTGKRKAGLHQKTKGLGGSHPAPSRASSRRVTWTPSDFFPTSAVPVRSAYHPSCQN